MKAPVVILDATGGIGRGVVQAAVNARRPVVAVSLDYAALGRLKAAHPGFDLTILPGSANDDSSAEALAADLRELHRPVAGVVLTTCREPLRGRVIEQTSEAFGQAIQAELLPHLAAARALVPLLAEAGRNGSYVVIGGPGSEQPWAGYGHRSVAAAAARMLLRVLHDEARQLSVRVQMLAVEVPARTDENVGHACAQWPSALAIGERALELVEQTQTRERADAIVRFNLAPGSSPPDRRQVHATRTAAPPQPAAIDFSAPSRAAMRPPESIASLDDTWALLKPLLTANK